MATAIYNAKNPVFVGLSITFLSVKLEQERKSWHLKLLYRKLDFFRGEGQPNRYLKMVCKPLNDSFALIQKPVN